MYTIENIKFCNNLVAYFFLLLISVFHFTWFQSEFDTFGSKQYTEIGNKEDFQLKTNLKQKSMTHFFNALSVRC